MSLLPRHCFIVDLLSLTLPPRSLPLSYSSALPLLLHFRRHPLIKELNHRVQKNKEDTTTKDLANVLFETATLRSGFSLQETASFAERIERMLRLSLDVPIDAKVGSATSPMRCCGLVGVLL